MHLWINDILLLLLCFSLISLLSLISWWFHRSFSCWSGQSCNTIKGSEGAFFPPPISQKNPLHLFSPDLNGSIAAYFSEEVEVDGLKKYRFRVFEESLMAPLENEENSCYCAREDHKEIERFCHLDGIIDISPCMGGVPIVLSKPHFFLGSPVLSSKLIGIQPDRSSHESYFDIDPVSFFSLFQKDTVEI